MKKIIIISVSIFLLLSSFVLGFFVKKSIDDKRIDSLNLAKMTLENKNEKYAEEIITLQKTADMYKTFISDNWEKITDDIYLDKDSIQKSKYTISAWFRTFHSEDEPEFYSNGVLVHYVLTEYDTDCKSDALHSGAEKQFDKNGNLLADYPSESDVCPDYSAYRDGKFIYDALCKYKK